MGKDYGLTSTEMEVMELLWQSDNSLSFKEILDYANEKLSKGWKKQTLNTYLSNLQKTGLIETDKDSRPCLYSPSCTKEEHIQRWTQKLVKETFDNSISSLVMAFTGGKKLSSKDVEELKKLI